MPSTMISRIDGLTTSVAVKPPIRIMTLAPVVLSGEQAIVTRFPNGTSTSVVVVSGDRVGINGQADQKQNGIYVVSSTAWRRALDFDGSLDAVHGTLVLDSIPLIWRLTTPDPVRFGTSAITFEVEDGFNQNDVLVTGKDLGLSDLNTIGAYEMEAFYFQASDAQALLTLNYPVQEAGELKALRGVGYGLQQEYTTYKNKKFIRALIGPFDGYSPWTPWVPVFTGANYNPNTFVFMPIGVPIPYPLAMPPVGCVAMVGQSFSASMFPDLALMYPALTLPDLRGEFIRGWSNGSSVDSGRILLSWQDHMIERHFHMANVSTIENIFDGGFVRAPAVGTSPTSETGGEETRPRNIALNFICRIQ